MLTSRDRHVAARRKKVWQKLDFHSKHHNPGVGFYRQHRHLTCGCSMCQWMAIYKKLRHKRRRQEQSLEVKRLSGELVHDVKLGVHNMHMDDAPEDINGGM